MQQLRRESPRIGIEALCWEIVNGQETSGLAVDLSPLGLRIERPYTGGPTRHEVPLQIEVPGIDEIMWAKASACFDVLVPHAGAAGGALGLIRRTGYRIVAAAARDLRMLKEFVIETDRGNRRQLGLGHLAPVAAAVRPVPAAIRAPLAPAADLGFASCYLRG